MYYQFFDKILKIYQPVTVTNKDATRYFMSLKMLASVVLKDFDKRFKNWNTVIDIGSNKGQFILILNKYFENIKYFLLNQLMSY